MHQYASLTDIYESEKLWDNLDNFYPFMPFTANTHKRGWSAYSAYSLKILLIMLYELSGRSYILYGFPGGYPKIFRRFVHAFLNWNPFTCFKYS